METDTGTGSDSALSRTHQHEHACTDAGGILPHADWRLLTPQETADVERGEDLSAGAVDVDVQHHGATERPLRGVTAAERFLDKPETGLVDDTTQAHGKRA